MHNLSLPCSFQSLHNIGGQDSMAMVLSVCPYCLASIKTSTISIHKPFRTICKP